MVVPVGTTRDAVGLQAPPGGGKLPGVAGQPRGGAGTTARDVRCARAPTRWPMPRGGCGGTAWRIAGARAATGRRSCHPQARGARGAPRGCEHVRRRARLRWAPRRAWRTPRRSAGPLIGERTRGLDTPSAALWREPNRALGTASGARQRTGGPYAMLSGTRRARSTRIAPSAPCRCACGSATPRSLTKTRRVHTSPACCPACGPPASLPGSMR